MTFDEYWYSCCDFHQCDECDVTVDCAVDKAIAQSAWKAAQPKWTLCKDAMPDKTVNCLCLDKDGYVSIDSYRENIHFMQDFIAWMPLPEVPAEINSGFNKQGVHI